MPRSAAVTLMITVGVSGWIPANSKFSAMMTSLAKISTVFRALFFDPAADFEEKSFFARSSQ